MHGSKTEVKKKDKFFHVTIAHLKENSKIKDKFFEKICTQKQEKTYFLAPKWGVDLYMGSTHTQVNRVVIFLQKHDLST